MPIEEYYPFPTKQTRAFGGTNARGILLPWIEELLNNCPQAGDGVHNWIFRVARQLLYHLAEQDACELIFQKARHCGRPLGNLRREIASQVKNAVPFMWQPRTGPARALANAPERPQTVASPPPKWPLADTEKIRQIVGGGFRLVHLWECSPIRFEADSSHAEYIVDILFPGNPILCVGNSQRKFAARRREIWRGHLDRLPLIVPNPSLDFFGHTAAGHLSEHTLEKTARPVYLVIEFDFSEFARDGKTLSRWTPLVREWRSLKITVADACAALHLHLALFLPLVCVTHSGGKSLHGWYYALDRNSEELRFFMRYAVRRGADPATWTRSQFVRIPDGLRDTGKRQTCFYLDPQKAVQL
jgi:hypothetical protein